MIQAYGKQFQISNGDKKIVDEMSQYQMAHRVRFSSAGDPFMCGDLGNYFIERFKELGGMTPEISKQLGWER